VFTSLGPGERPAGRKGAVRRGLPCRAQTLARCAHQACRVAGDDECLRASAIVLCTGGVEQPPLRLFAVRLVKELRRLRCDGVHDSRISVRMSTSLTTVTWGSILRHAGRQESVAYDSDLHGFTGLVRTESRLFIRRLPLRPRPSGWADRGFLLRLVARSAGRRSTGEENEGPYPGRLRYATPTCRPRRVPRQSRPR
jgi:hypothetical protein